MSKGKGMARREFLRLSAMATGALAACTAAPTPISAATAPTKASEPKLGAGLIGKLEGPVVITDPARFPKAFKEAPQLAELVRAGKLPSVEKRLPEEPLVVKPLHEIGQYGGIMRRGFTGPADAENMSRMLSTERLLFSDYTGVKMTPCVAKGWKMSEDGKNFTLYLRKGAKWSDGEPFTADDIIFWHQDIDGNRELSPTRTPEMVVGGKRGMVEKADDHTIVYKFPEPYFLFEEIMQGDTHIGGGPARFGGLGLFMGGYCCAHYLKKFHPKYTTSEEIGRAVKDGKFDSWVSMFRFKYNYSLNPELPTMAPWRTVNPINTSTWILERNPYYVAVDTEGNQLPYIDKVVLRLAESTEVLNLRAIAGEIDFQWRHLSLAKLPVFLENRQRGNYRVHLDPDCVGGTICLYANLSYDTDPEVAKWLGSRDFRRALSLGIDRDQVNETFAMGLGVPGSPVVADDHPYNPGPEYRKLWSVYDPKKANEMLDKIGLDKKDAQGFRLRTDGKGPLRVDVFAFAAYGDYPQIVEMIVDQWKKIGIIGQLKAEERGLIQTKLYANELTFWAFVNTASEGLWAYPSGVIPAASDSWLGVKYYEWFATDGAKGKKPHEPELIRALELYRAAKGMKYPDRVSAAKEIWRLAVDQQWTIGVVGFSPQNVRIAKTNMGNVPARISFFRTTRTEGGVQPATLYWKS